ncbi:zinc ribbon domain-containing protein [Culicoidibacter larvae]|nr:zinc ribbon domain-containing protein [Culicoidibacter larvae]
MQVCSGCGAQIVNGARKCSYCGTEIKIDISEQSFMQQAREYRNKQQFAKAIEAYSKWVADDLRNSDVWLEYMDFLLDYAKLQGYRNFGAITRAYSMMLSYILRAELFAGFNDQTRAMSLFEEIVEVYQQLGNATVGNLQVEKVGDLQQLLNVVSQLATTGNEQPSFSMFNKLQLLFTAFFEQGYANSCLQVNLMKLETIQTIPNLFEDYKVRAALNGEQLIKQEQIAKKVEVSIVFPIIRGILFGTSVLILCLFIMVAISMSGSMNEIGIMILVSLFVAVASFTVEYLLAKTYSPFKYICRVIGYISTFITFITFLQYLGLTIIDAIYRYQLTNGKVIIVKPQPSKLSMLIDQYISGQLSRRDVIIRLFS